MRLTRMIGLGLMGAGALALLAPLASWFTARREQEILLARFERHVPVASSPGPVVQDPAAPAVAPVPAAAPPSGPYLIDIPAAGIRYMVEEGIDDEPLGRGPGHYPATPLPGEPGNAAIAGHRTVKGMPSFFYKLDSLKPGDTIVITYPDRTLTFLVDRVFLTSPYDISVLDSTPGAILTLTTCDPPGLADRRLIVRARLVNAGEAPPP